MTNTDQKYEAEILRLTLLLDEAVNVGSDIERMLLSEVEKLKVENDKLTSKLARSEDSHSLTLADFSRTVDIIKRSSKANSDMLEINQNLDVEVEKLRNERIELLNMRSEPTELLTLENDRLRAMISNQSDSINPTAYLVGLADGRVDVQIRNGVIIPLGYAMALYQHDEAMSKS